MKKIKLVSLTLVATALLVGCGNDKETVSSVIESEVASTSTLESSTITEETTESSTVESVESTESVENTETIESAETIEVEPVAVVVQEETYEALKKRTLDTPVSARANWTNKEWEAFGMALYENGLSMDDNGNIISQSSDLQKNQETTTAEPTTLSEFVDKYGMTPATYKMDQEGMSVEEALRSTPKYMKTSGEIQLGFAEYGIQ